jgi:hypothetical protein
MATGPDYVRLLGKSGSSAQTTKVTRLTLAVQKLKNRNATKNDIFQFDLQVESACALND